METISKAMDSSQFVSFHHKAVPNFPKVNNRRKKPMGARNPPSLLSKRANDPAQSRKDDGHGEYNHIEFIYLLMTFYRRFAGS